MAPKVYEAPKFYPSHRDMAGPFEKYIESIEDELAEFGLGIIVPPRGWKPTSAKYESMNFEVPKPIKQHVTGSRGIYQSVHVEQKGMSLQDFKAMANAKENLAPLKVDTLGPEHDDLERYFWKNVTHFPPLYGADAEGSLFDPDHKGWNIRDLDTCLSKTLKEHGASLPGVTTPYLYVGMWRSMFAWHTEDVDLYSVNYLHFGEPKSWYCIPPALRTRFEVVVQGLAPEFHRNCPEFLRHKETLVTPFLIQQHNIPLVKAVQTPGQWIINFPSAYHSGFNHGFNCAESTNFATRRWIEYGAKAKACKCSGESVRIDMRLFGVEPPPPKVKPGMLLLAPPLPVPELQGAAVPPVAHGKMVKRKALPIEGANEAANQAPLIAEVAFPSKKQKAPGSSGKKRKASQENGVLVSQVDPGLAPGLELLPVPPPAKKPKAAAGSGSSKKKGGAVDGSKVAASGASKPKAPKAQGKKAQATEAAPAGGAVGAVLPKKSPSPKKGKGTEVAPSSGTKKATPPKGSKAQKEGTKQRVKKQEKEGVVEVGGAAQSSPIPVAAPKAKKEKKSAKATKAAPLISGGELENAAAAGGAKSKGGAKTPANAGAVDQAKQIAKVLKIIRIKFNPPAACLISPAAETVPAKLSGAAARGGVDLKQGAHKKGGQEVTPPKTLPLAAVQPPKGALTGAAREGGVLKVPTPETPTAQPRSATDSDKIQTRRRGALLDEPLAVLFKDPPTGTKLQGRKRVSDEAPPAGKEEVGAKPEGTGSLLPLCDASRNPVAPPNAEVEGHGAAQGGSPTEGTAMRQEGSVSPLSTPQGDHTAADSKTIPTTTPPDVCAEQKLELGQTVELEQRVPVASALSPLADAVPPVGSVTVEHNASIDLPGMTPPVEESPVGQGLEAQPPPLPKLVSPSKQRKGKKKGGPKQPTAGGLQEETPKVSRPRIRRRGIPPERPGTHQMQRRSRGGQAPAGGTVQEENRPPLGESAQEATRGHAEAIAGAEAAGLVGEGHLKDGVERALEVLSGGELVNEKVSLGKVTGETLEGPVERLKGGGADEAGLEELVAAVPEQLSPSRGVSSPQRSARGGMVLMRVEGSRLVLRRVKHTEPPPLESEGQERTEDVAVRGMADLEQAGLPELEASSQVPEKQEFHEANDALASTPQEDTLRTSEPGCEPVMCDVILPTSPGDGELETSPKALPTGPAHPHAELKPNNGEEALDTSSQDSLRLTHENEVRHVH